MTIQINAQLCKGCGFCARFCPNEALAMGRVRNKKGDYLPDYVHGRCAAGEGCAVCADMCPEGAVTIKGMDSRESTGSVPPHGAEYLPSCG